MNFTTGKSIYYIHVYTVRWKSEINRFSPSAVYDSLSCCFSSIPAILQVSWPKLHVLSGLPARFSRYKHPRLFQSVASGAVWASWSAADSLMRSRLIPKERPKSSERARWYSWKCTPHGTTPPYEMHRVKRFGIASLPSWTSARVTSASFSLQMKSRYNCTVV